MKTRRKQKRVVCEVQTRKRKSTRSCALASTVNNDLASPPRKKLRSSPVKRKVTKRKPTRRVSTISSSSSATSSPVKKPKASPKKAVSKVPSGICNFCKSIDGKEYELGELRTCEDITAHMYCLYFSPGLTQNGLFDEGINGFLLPDIRKELRRASQLRCSYCDQRSAAIGCGIASLKCPNCLNSGNFITSVKENGICVPPRDYLVDSEAVNTASENVVWECCAEECSCENGRSHNGDNEWELFACDQCGSNAVHMACASLSEGSEWSCEVCRNPNDSLDPLRTPPLYLTEKISISFAIKLAIKQQDRFQLISLN
ncbi:Zinc ion binding [Tyrophagus putrescentiae]|nr:Zinc ion binding [Tyrophagus putrescentiae]